MVYAHSGQEELLSEHSTLVEAKAALDQAATSQREKTFPTKDI